MEIRKDFDSVSSYIFRLLSIGEAFRCFNKDWGHLKNEEDFQFVLKIPYEDRYKVESVYSDGRDMALYMYDALLAINNDFSRYPTLTAIIDELRQSWAYGNYDPTVPDTAKSICSKHGVNIWSINQMVALFKKQEQLLAAVRITLKMLEESDLYKMENDIPIMKQEANINVSGVTGSSININSSSATASVANVSNYNEPTIFSELISAVKSNKLDSKTETFLIDNVQALAASHQNGGFKEAYKDFMQNVSTHITVFGPLIAGLSTLL